VCGGLMEKRRRVAASQSGSVLPQAKLWLAAS